MSSLEQGDDDGAPPIRDAGCLVLVDRSAARPRLLLGRRLASQVFLPNKWVFPGGRVDDDDRALAKLLTRDPEANSADAVRLPFALAALRELLEEAGILVGTKGRLPEALTAWTAFARLGQIPAHDHLRPLARAITPPGQPRRFDTWFFLADYDCATSGAGEPDGELLDLGWFTLAEIRDLDLPYITRLIVDDVASALDCKAGTTAAEIPFYFQDNDVYRRILTG